MSVPTPYVGYPPGPYQNPYPVPRNNGLAIAAMVLGIVWVYWIGSILALIFGYVALNQIKNAPPHAPQNGKGMAIAGIVLGWVGVGFLAITIAMLGAASSSGAGY